MFTRDEMVTVCTDLPPSPNTSKVYRLSPKNPDPSFYLKRTDRNLGWLSKQEQSRLCRTTIGVAGCGGMGAQLAEKFLRLGVGEIRIADTEVFDASNINRQFGAQRNTIGQNKALVTAKLLRNICDDTELVVYPQGITPATVSNFVSGCDVICDEIEFWAVGSRMLLHRKARQEEIPVFNCNTVGFGTRLFLFTPQSTTMEEVLGLDYEIAIDFEQRFLKKHISLAEVRRMMGKILQGLVPELPHYSSKEKGPRSKKMIDSRLQEEGKAPIIATNPPMATGFMADRVLLYLLRKWGAELSVPATPEMPAYLYFDAAFMEAKIVQRRY